MSNKVKVYKCRVEKKIKQGKIPTFTELKTLKEAGIDTTKYALIAIEKYKDFLGALK